MGISTDDVCLDLRPMRVEDADSCAEMQCRLIGGTVLNCAGRRFVRDVYFRGIAESAICLSLVAADRERVAGFCAYALDYEAFRRELMRRLFWPAVRALAGQAAQRPADALRFAAFVVRGRPAVHSEARAEGLTMAVDEQYRWSGVAFRLARECLAGLDNRYRGRVKVQCFSDDLALHGFYRLFGFGEPVTFSFMGSQYTTLVRNCPAQPVGRAVRRPGA